MAKFDDFQSALTTALEKFAADAWKTRKDAATKDGQAFLKSSQEDLKRWTGLLEQELLTPDEFKSLLAGKQDSLRLAALKQAGLTKVALDRFTNGLLDTIVDTAVAFFL